MKKQIDITSLRSLLERYYAGETDIREEHVITEWFATHSDSEIPDDLAADARMFRDISAAHTRTIADNTISRLGKRRHTSFALWISASAAAIAIIVTAGIRYTPHPTDTPADHPILAESTALPPSVPSRQIATPDATPAHATKDQQPTPTAIARKKKRHRAATSREIVVTDTAEAGRHIEEVMRLLADNLGNSRRRLAKAGDDIRHTSETINSKLYEENS